MFTQGGFSAWRDLPTDEQIAVHNQDIELNLFVSDVTKEDAVNNSIPAASSTNRSIDPNVVDGMQALRTGLGLMRASQLTMVRFQLALYKSNRRTAMQALDTFLELDAEMEGLEMGRAWLRDRECQYV